MFFFTGAIMAPSRISPDGKTVRTFNLAGTRYDGHAHIWDFAPARNGGLHELIFFRLKDDEGYRLLSFDKDGKLENDIAIDLPFEPAHLAELGNGDFVVEGRKKKKELGGHTGAPGMAIVDSRGLLVRNLKLLGDLTPPAKASGNPAAQSDSWDAEEYDQSLNLSTATSADDGNVYVFEKHVQAHCSPLRQEALSARFHCRCLAEPRFTEHW
jgi:hypothetical protein